MPPSHSSALGLRIHFPHVLNVLSLTSQPVLLEKLSRQPRWDYGTSGRQRPYTHVTLSGAPAVSAHWMSCSTMA